MTSTLNIWDQVFVLHSLSSVICWTFLSNSLHSWKAERKYSTSAIFIEVYAVTHTELVSSIAALCCVEQLEVITITRAMPQEGYPCISKDWDIRYRPVHFREGDFKMTRKEEPRHST